MVGDDNEGDGFTGLLDHLQEKDKPYYTMGGGEPGYGVAVFPKPFETEEEWEKDCIAMHANQKTLTVPDKPTNTSLRHKRGLTRGD